MFILMPFWSKEGGMTVPYAPGGVGPLKELSLLRDNMYPFAEVKLAKEVLFEGDPDNSELNYGNKPPKFRVWTIGWTEQQWDFFLGLLEEVPDTLDGSIKVAKYPQFGGRIFYTPKPYDILVGSEEGIDDGWTYPVKVLEWLVANGKITAPQQIQYIAERKEKERKARLAGKVPDALLEEIKKEDEELKKTKAQILPDTVSQTLEKFDPNSEFEEVAKDLGVVPEVEVEEVKNIPNTPDFGDNPLENQSKPLKRGAGGKFVGAK